MRTIFLFVCYTLMLTFSLKSQVNLVSFTQNIAEEYKIRAKKEKYDIDKFMKYGYKKRPELKDESICKIPVYSIFSKSKFTNSDRVKDSLFVYLNPKSLCIDNVLFYKEKQPIAVAYPSYLNKKDQPLGSPGKGLIAELANMIIEEKPEMIFSLSQSNRIYFFLKNDSLRCYLFNEKQNKYTSMTPKEFLKIISESEFYFMTHLHKPFPLIYSR